ncbi:hypothetical protein GOBAR_DD26985 [Gossypium barbadense]|nr:hypothetical protein GOBAR_DD26985 [Gossypium barbadense]
MSPLVFSVGVTKKNNSQNGTLSSRCHAMVRDMVLHGNSPSRCPIGMFPDMVLQGPSHDYKDLPMHVPEHGPYMGSLNKMSWTFVQMSRGTIAL